MNYRKSIVLEKLRKGEIATCTKVNFADSRIVELASLIGFDCIWGDMEHVSNDWSVIEKQILASKVYNVDFLVRVAKGSYSDYIRPLELDATGIMIPHVMSKDEGKEIVKTTRFHPLGRRPIDGGNADALYCSLPTKEYIKLSNEQRFVVVQIEDYEALEHIEEIAKLDGIDMLFFGPSDFSHSIGFPEDDSQVIKARELVADIANKNNKIAGTVTTIEDAQHIVDLGYRFISIGSDVLGLNSYFNEVKDKFDQLKK